jgi:hypothetical protein
MLSCPHKKTRSAKTGYFILHKNLKTMTKNKNSHSLEKVKVLCLHGYRQDGNALKSKLGSFRKIAGKYSVFEFVDAPHMAPALEPALDSDSEKNGKYDQRSWWFNKDDGTFKGLEILLMF